MAIVRIAQTNTAVSWTAPNIDSMVLRTSSPVTEISLPEHGADEAYVVKFSGNAMTGNITSIIKEQKISPFRGLSHNPTSVFGQMRALHQDFITTGIEDAYTLQMWEGDNDSGTPDWEIPCVITGISTNESKDAPDLWTCSIDITIGQNTIVVEDI